MSIRAILFDLEGVLYQRDMPIPGALDVIAEVRARGLPVRFLTNTTTKPRSAIVGRLNAMGFAVEPGEVFSPPLAARRDLEAAGMRRVHLATVPALAEDFVGFELVDDAPDAVVMGDLGPGYDFDRLNSLFAMLVSGARLIALHKNRYWRKDRNLILDLGPFVALLEYAADTEARIVGKPARAFFEFALADMNVSAGETLMIGDDIEGDVGGGQNAGLRAVQVRTGKFRETDESHPLINPDFRLNSIADLPALLNTAD